MSESRTSLLKLLAPPVAACLEAVPLGIWQTVQEVRLRVGAPIRLSTATGQESLPLTVTQPLLQECFQRLCGYAVHTHQTELSQGFVTATGGYRVGIAGTAVIKDGVITSYRSLSSLCIRIPRKADGCSIPLLKHIVGDPLRSMLLCGAPASGKTTLLRDLARLLGEQRRVCVVDERSELSAFGLPYCDVLCGCPKAEGMMQAVRTLSPELLIVDELGSEAEWQAVTQSLFCGVAVIASAHITSPSDLALRPYARRTLEAGGFSLVTQLPFCVHYREASTIRRAGDYLEDGGDPVDRVFLCRDRMLGGTPTASA